MTHLHLQKMRSTPEQCFEIWKDSTEIASEDSTGNEVFLGETHVRPRILPSDGIALNICESSKLK